MLRIEYAWEPPAFPPALIWTLTNNAVRDKPDISFVQSFLVTVSSELDTIVIRHGVRPAAAPARHHVVEDIWECNKNM